MNNHVKDLVSIDFFTVPAARFKVLFVLVVLSHERRRVVHFNVTENPTARRTAQQIVEAFPWNTAPRYLLRDRDSLYSPHFQRRFQGLGMEQGDHRPVKPLAESLRGTPHWQYPP